MVSTAVYATTEELKTRIGQTQDTDDALLTALLTATSRLWDQFCNRVHDGFEAAAVATARQYPGTGDGWVYIDECVEITAVGHKSITATTYTALTVATDILVFRGSAQSPQSIRYGITPFTGIMLRPNAVLRRFDKGKHSETLGIEPTVEVTAKWGYSVTTPELIREATIAQATLFYKRGRGAWADALTDGNFGEQRFVRMLDPSIKLMVSASGFKRPRLGAR
jgi:hypothetical protein